eukprot:scaffold332937_cov48-Prasinocladus_malaysianus.AAC.1
MDIQMAFAEEARRGKSYTELYELVQHAGNVLPRLACKGHPEGPGGDVQGRAAPNARPLSAQLPGSGDPCWWSQQHSSVNDSGRDQQSEKQSVVENEAGHRRLVLPAGRQVSRDKLPDTGS